MAQIRPGGAQQQESRPDSGMASRRFYAWELGIVLALSLGRSAIYAVLQLAENLSIAPLAAQSATGQRSRSRSEFFDATFQVLDALFALAPVGLVVYLVFLHGGNPFRRWGLDFRRPGCDLGLGAGLFVIIGVGTMGVYFLGRTLGITAQIIPADVTQYWWTTPVLLLSAVRHSLLEEIIMVAYLFDRAQRIWPQLASPAAGRDTARSSAHRGLRVGGTGIWVMILASALLRGSYHLYQGFGPGAGNAIMGIIFGWLYLKYGRVMPLVIAHFLLDAVAFLAFPLVLELFGLEAI